LNTVLRLALSLILCSILGYTQTTAPTRKWTRIIALNDKNTNEVALARSADSKLHIVWKQQTTPQKMEMMHAVMDTEGNVLGAPAVIVGDWATLTTPTLLLEKNGELRLVFAGLSGVTGSPHNAGSIYSSLSKDGSSWKLASGQLSASGNAYSDSTAAAIDGKGVPYVAWGAEVQKGLSASAQPQKLQTGCCAYQPGLATDEATGEVVVAWYSNASGADLGLFAQTVSPSMGGKTPVPGSVTTYGGTPNSSSIDQQVPISGRIGAPGLFVSFCAGYPTAKSVDLWKYGQSQPVTIANVNGGCHAHVSPGPEGRLWMLWSSAGKMYAARSNRAVSRFGPAISLGTPSKWETTYRVKGEGSAGPLEAFAHVSAGGTVATWHTHVLPVLAITLAPIPIPVTGGDITFTVTDVGDPVAGATIHAAGQTLTTDASGHASAHVAKGGAIPVTVTAPGYAELSTTLGGPRVGAVKGRPKQ
jgi:hypothetical protein